MSSASPLRDLSEDCSLSAENLFGDSEGGSEGEGEGDGADEGESGEDNIGVWTRCQIMVKIMLAEGLRLVWAVIVCLASVPVSLLFFISDTPTHLPPETAAASKMILSDS